VICGYFWAIAATPEAELCDGTKRRKYLEENVGALAVKPSAADQPALSGP
jgi:hypothetical protein